MDNLLPRILFVIGALLIFTAILVEKGIRLPFGRLPGDVIIKKGNFSFYFPLTTCIIISILLGVIFLLLRKR